MSDAKIIQLGVGKAHISIQWGTQSLCLAAYNQDGVASPVFFGVEPLDDLLDALHEARRDLAKVEREKITFRIPPELKDALEAKARRDGLTQNAAFTEAVEDYIVG